ncbi:metalloregulator ArsR/SmtB family transcription factor [Acaricomes phytoseiuli]|uniref:ArsR/SmtB family transcription factor n=1 Tax=Acaricomes phytoseiuli TaxID=291968 RepID=UPI002222562E|nr:metalloregulator ArsR/SmtB family transcription factor [Acaricomes phytoseiuli]MCW1250044.1 metalloregulator ArsR/SmtB family transcription factor [Acaricomes phytoseiuli]
MVNQDVFAVLAEPTRREILTLLRRGDLSVGELVDGVGTSQPTVSKHLKVLREAGLVTMRAEGQRRFYSIEHEPLLTARQWFDDVADPGSESEPRVLPGAKAQESRLDHREADSEQDGESVSQQIGRSVGRAATKAADLFANLPKFGRRKDHGSPS